MNIFTNVKNVTKHSNMDSLSHIIKEHTVVFLLAMKMWKKVKLTTCFHKFPKYESTNFLCQIICNTICFSQMLKTEKKTLFLNNKKIIFFFNWEILVKNSSISYSENSWNHVVNSIIVTCDKCGEQFLHRGALQQHMKKSCTKKNERERAVCDLCSPEQSFSSPNNLIR